jgi:FkbM family methyltransferase
MAALAPDGDLFAFEPLPHLAELLRRRFPRVHVHECALSDHTGAAAFQHVINDPAYSGLLRRIYDRPDPQIEEIVVRVDRMDNLVPPDCDVAFIKIDVEGAEYHVMRGGIATIQRCRPIIVFEAGRKSTDCYGVGPDQISALLISECGMMISTMDRWLRRLPAYSRGEFRRAYIHGSDYYFIAYPDASGTP